MKQLVAILLVCMVLMALAVLLSANGCVERGHDDRVVVEHRDVDHHDAPHDDHHDDDHHDDDHR